MAEHEPSVGETSEWFTPPEIFTALGLTFDLDPCSPGPGHWVPARQIYTEANDGLRQPWHGLVFMNPPFGDRFGHVPWLEKFLDYGNGVAIVRAYTSSSWWHELMPRAEMILFPKGKTKFIRPDGSIGTAPGHGIVLIGMGEIACAALVGCGLGMVWDRRPLTAITPGIYTNGELTGHISDVLARSLSPERALLALRRRVDGIDADDVLLAALTLLTEQRGCIECLEREAINSVRRNDRLESECSDLHDELEALRTTVRNLSYWRDDPEAA
jgi:hypothetical protein